MRGRTSQEGECIEDAQSGLSVEGQDSFSNFSIIFPQNTVNESGSLSIFAVSVNFQRAFIFVGVL